MSVVRVSILTVPAEHLDAAAERMRTAEAELRGIRSLDGLLAYFVGVDRSTSQLVNVSFWVDDEAARQLSTFTPMLELGAEFGAYDASFLRPIPNFEMLWQWGDVTGPTD